MDFSISKTAFTVAALCAASVVEAGTAIVCTGCTDEASARQAALSLVNPLQCTPSDGPKASCTSKDKTVTLVDEASAKAYRFNVYHEDTPPWTVRAAPLPLTQKEREAFAILVGFQKDLADAVSAASTNFNAMQIDHTAGSPQQLSTSATDNCPTDTALTALLNPNRLSEIKTEAKLAIGSELVSRSNYINLHPVSYALGAAIDYLGATFSISSTRGGERSRSYAVNFSESERNSALGDSLAFTVNVIGHNGNNMPLLEMELSDASIIAGYELGELKGNGGPLEIDNECLLARFDDAATFGVFGKNVSPVGGGGSTGAGPTGDSTSGGTGGSGGGGCQIVEFVQNGQLLYTFRICE